MSPQAGTRRVASGRRRVRARTRRDRRRLHHQRHALSAHRLVRECAPSSPRSTHATQSDRCALGRRARAEKGMVRSARCSTRGDCASRTGARRSTLRLRRPCRLGEVDETRLRFDCLVRATESICDLSDDLPQALSRSRDGGAEFGRVSTLKVMPKPDKFAGIPTNRAGALGRAYPIIGSLCRTTTIRDERVSSLGCRRSALERPHLGLYHRASRDQCGYCA